MQLADVLLDAGAPRRPRHQPQVQRHEAASGARVRLRIFSARFGAPALAPARALVLACVRMPKAARDSHPAANEEHPPHSDCGALSVDPALHWRAPGSVSSSMCARELVYVSSISPRVFVYLCLCVSGDRYPAVQVASWPGSSRFLIRTTST